MDPTVEEAIQRLKEGKASPEDARIAFEAGYQGGPNTQAYYKELGLLEPPQDAVKPNLFDQNAGPVDFNKWQGNNLTPTMTADGKFVANTNMTGETPEVDPMDLKDPTVNQELAGKFAGRKIPNFSKFKDTEAFDKGMQAWSPLAPSILKGGDMSGEAKGYRAGATIQDRAAADNAKILQWNKQRAMDNTLADKVAAAQAQGKWKQNANALGAEGGAAVVASQNEAVTPDIMAQKQYQSQQMNTATQNLAEVNARKLAAQDNRINADRTDYKTQVEESQNAYKYNLATARNAQNKNTEEKKEEPEAETTTPEATEKPNGKVEDTGTQDSEPQAAAETNQQSQATETATQEISDDQKLKDLADEIEGIHKAVETMKSNSQDHTKELRDLKAQYDKVKPLFDELAAKSKNPPPTPATPDFGMFDEELSKVPSSILTGVSQKFLN